MITLKDIPRLTSEVGCYRANTNWNYLEKWIEENSKKMDGFPVLDLNPDFQRGHVWTQSQQIRFVEHVLSGGRSSSLLKFNCPSWLGYAKHNYDEFVIVDGKQRLEAVRSFLRGEFKAHGYYFGEYDKSVFRLQTDFIIMVNTLQTRKEVLQWYLDLNTGGTVHTTDEIEKVRELLEKESI